MLAQRRIADTRQHIDGERLDEHAPRLGLADAAGAQIEERGLVEIADRGAMAAFDVVGENLELGLGVDGSPGAQQQIAVLELCVGLLRVRPDGNTAEEDAMGALIGNALPQLAGPGPGGGMVDDGRMRRLLLAAQEIGAIEVALRALALKPHDAVMARQAAAERQHEALIAGAGRETRLRREEMECL